MELNDFDTAIELDDAQIAAAWDDETGDDAESLDEITEPEADQQTEPETKEQEPPATEHPEQEQEEQPKEADQPLTFTLKHLDEVRTVDKDEVVKLAQKGLDYDRIRNERDQLREYRKENDRLVSFIKERAAKSGMTPDTFLDLLYKQELMASGMDEQSAIRQIALEKREAALNAKEAVLSEAEAKQKAESERTLREAEEKKKREEQQKADMQRFLQKFPDVKPEEIPQEVWAAVRNGEMITHAYAEYRLKQLEAELSALKQNQKNQQTSTGSMQTKGKSVEDLIDRYWNDE
jgi:hypothetical protein